MFTNWILLVLAANAIVLIVLIGVQLRLRSRIRRLQNTLYELARNPQELPPDLTTLADEAPRMVIMLDILNPLSLVAERSWFGGKISALTPSLMRRLVLTQTRDQLRDGMKENGVEVDVRIVRLG